jgi:hypothetical protein
MGHRETRRARRRPIPRVLPFAVSQCLTFWDWHFHRITRPPIRLSQLPRSQFSRRGKTSVTTKIHFEPSTQYGCNKSRSQGRRRRSLRVADYDSEVARFCSLPPFPTCRSNFTGLLQALMGESNLAQGGHGLGTERTRSAGPRRLSNCGDDPLREDRVFVVQVRRFSKVPMPRRPTPWLVTSASRQRATSQPLSG